MHLTYEPIQAQQFCENFSNESGASVLFFGVVRNHSQNREVLYLEYESYAEMAEKMFEALIHQALEEWPIEKIKILHRLGKIYPSEIAVAIDVRSAHRDEAYKASRFLIEEIKHQVPIWKKEYFMDGTSEWGRCHAGIHASA